MGCRICQPETTSPATGLCPGCASLPEDRALVAFFRRFARLPPRARVLHVAPPAPLLRVFPSLLPPDSLYTAVAPVRLPEADLLQPPHRFLAMDITRLGFSDSSFDVILCNHVLSYVRSDFLAMSELHRCLKAGGVAFLSAEHGEGKSRRAAEGSGRPGTGKEWDYGEDYFDRLGAAGLFVLKLPLAAGPGCAPEEEPRLAPGAEQVLCFKFREAQEAFLRSFRS